ncbi:MAG: hypothetical protein IJT47_02470 [Selenomonadaceae bacterium]|nr:hypothetical protein [Selenomonadaceae bacterium]MBQ7493274.1 hypothetical protein [Selenomonadaceae bacterium]
MKNFFCKLLILLAVIFLAQSFSANVYAATPRGIPSGGKGATEAAAIEDMKLSTIKRVLAQITERSDDPASPYQQLIKLYNSFIDKVHVEKRGKNSSGAFVTGRVEIKYADIQLALGQLVKIFHANDVTREVYVFVRFVGNVTEEQLRSAENVILQRYLTRLKENKFVVANADEVIGQLNQTRSMDFNQFVAFVKQKTKENPEICTAIVGEIRMAKELEHADGVTMSCEMEIHSLDCLNNFTIIEDYDGSEVLSVPSMDVNRYGMFLFEKAAVTSSKSITDSLVKYWAQK